MLLNPKSCFCILILGIAMMHPGNLFASAGYISIWQSLSHHRTVYLLGDLHNIVTGHPAIEAAQRAIRRNFLSSFIGKNVRDKLVLIEDTATDITYEYNGQPLLAVRTPTPDSKSIQFLHRLSKDLKQLQPELDVRNVEFRQFRNLLKDGVPNSLNKHVTMNHIFTVELTSYLENMQMAGELEAQGYPRQVIKSGRRQTNAYFGSVVERIFVDDVTRDLDATLRLGAFSQKGLFTLRLSEARLLDLRILHSMAQTKESRILVCAGAFHVLNLESFLQSLGFINVFKETYLNESEFNSTKRSGRFTIVFNPEDLLAKLSKAQQLQDKLLAEFFRED